MPSVVLLFRVLQLNLNSFHFKYLQEFMVRVIFSLYTRQFSVLIIWLAAVSQKKLIRTENNMGNHVYLKPQCKMNIVVSVQSIA